MLHGLLFRQTSLICFQNLPVQMLVQIIGVVKQLPSLSFDCYSGYCPVARNSSLSVSDHVTKRVAFIFFCVQLMAEAVSRSGKLIE